MKQWILILLLSVALFSCTQKQTYKWDGARKVFESPTYNIKWDLSELGDWRIADKEQLPANMLFCGAVDDISVAIVTIEKTENLSEIQNVNEFIKGFITSTFNLSKVFPGINHKTIQAEKCHYMFRDAIRFGAIEYVSDARLRTDEAVPFLYGGYLFENGNRIFMPLVCMPLRYVEEYGDDAMEMFFERLSYINASKELHQN